MSYVRHIAGQYDNETKSQICILCGALVHTNRNTFYLDGEPMDDNNGFAPGEVFISADSSMRTKHISETTPFKNCTAPKTLTEHEDERD